MIDDVCCAFSSWSANSYLKVHELFLLMVPDDGGSCRIGIRLILVKYQCLPNGYLVEQFFPVCLSYAVGRLSHWNKCQIVQINRQSASFHYQA